MGVHSSHVTRFSDASTFDEICVNCGATDEVPGGFGRLVYKCPNPNKPFKSLDEYYNYKEALRPGKWKLGN